MSESSLKLNPGKTKQDIYWTMATTIIIKMPSINYQTQWSWNRYRNVKSPVHGKTGTLRQCTIWPSLDLCLDLEGFDWSPSCFSLAFFQFREGSRLFSCPKVFTHALLRTFNLHLSPLIIGAHPLDPRPCRFLTYASHNRSPCPDGLSPGILIFSHLAFFSAAHLAPS